MLLFSLLLHCSNLHIVEYGIDSFLLVVMISLGMKGCVCDCLFLRACVGFSSFGGRFEMIFCICGIIWLFRGLGLRGCRPHVLALRRVGFLNGCNVAGMLCC